LTNGDEGDYILTLNDDTVVCPDYLQTLLDAAGKHPNSLIGSIAVSSEDESTVVDGGVYVNWLTAKYTNRGKGSKYADLLGEGITTHAVDVLPGRGTLIPGEVFKNIGLYNEKLLPHYGADYEFSRRAQKRGYTLFIHYGAVVISKEKETGLNNRTKNLGWGNLMKSFFSIRSANNLKQRRRFARLCCNKWQFPLFYLCDSGRVIAGSLLYQIGIKK
jgi:GT2 family glycosyltransferase